MCTSLLMVELNYGLTIFGRADRIVSHGLKDYKTRKNWQCTGVAYPFIRARNIIFNMNKSLLNSCKNLTGGQITI